MAWVLPPIHNWHYYCDQVKFFFAKLIEFSTTKLVFKYIYSKFIDLFWSMMKQKDHLYNENTNIWPRFTAQIAYFNAFVKFNANLYGHKDDSRFRCANCKKSYETPIRKMNWFAYAFPLEVVFTLSREMCTEMICQ